MSKQFIGGEKPQVTSPAVALAEKLQSVIGLTRAEIKKQFPGLVLTPIVHREPCFSLGELKSSDWWSVECRDAVAGLWTATSKEIVNPDESRQNDLLLALKTIFESLNKTRGVAVKKVTIRLRPGEEQICEALGIEVRKQETGLWVAELDFTLSAKFKEYRIAMISALIALGVFFGVSVGIAQKYKPLAGEENKSK